MSRKQSLGLSMVELMIAMAIGLVVVGAVLAFTMSSLTANSEYVQSTRLNQELRNSMDFVSRELRRAGYDQDVAGYIARVDINAPVSSPFAKLFIDNDLNGDGTAGDACVIYAYDRTGGTNGTIDLSNGEIRALRLASRTVDGLDVGVLEIAESAAGATPACNGASPNYVNYPPSCNGGWCALSDPRVLNITKFELARQNEVGLTQPVSATSTALTIRQINISLQGQLRRSEDGTVTRGIQNAVKVRADCLQASSVCDDPPGA